jgi:hypothetical protein
VTDEPSAASLLRSTLRIRREVTRVRRMASALGDEYDLPVEVSAAADTLVRWASRLAAAERATGARPETNSGP